MSDLNKLGLAEARDALRKGETTSVELTKACLSAIDKADALNAFVHKTPEIALERAAAADARLQQDDAPAMCGLPVGIKDLFCTKGVASQAASKILEGFVPEYESTVSQQLADNGAVMLGKLNMDEFAMGSSNETSTYGNAVSPWRRGNDDAPLTPGGSSGGSAAAVAADLCLAATGTDTGGSIRQPAAFTGTVGIKPTYGRCSRWGVVAFASSLDQAGPMTKSVRDAAIMLGAMAFLSAALVSITAFTRIVIVLSFVKRSLTTQEIPPNPVIIGLAFFLTAFVMGPTLDSIHEHAIAPYLSEELTGGQAITVASNELHGFMLYQTRKSDLAVMINLADVDFPETAYDTPMRILIPAFMISEIKTGFIMGFCIYVPFLLIDLVVSSVLMSLGMMMMPPVIISTPCKLMLFVLVDGWDLVIGSLLKSFS